MQAMHEAASCIAGDSSIASDIQGSNYAFMLRQRSYSAYDLISSPEKQLARLSCKHLRGLHSLQRQAW